MSILAQPAVAVITLLGILVLVHEAGHFLIGRAVGIAVETFSIGFGPKIFSFRRGQTEYRMAWIPLGGYVKFYGSTATEAVPEAVTGLHFHNAPAWKKALTVAAGPVANFLLAIACYGLLGYHGIPWPPAAVGEVMRGSPAERAGLVFGDTVLVAGGLEIHNWRELQKQIVESGGQPLRLKIRRNNNELDLTVVPDMVPDEDKILRKQKGQIGISPAALSSILSISDPQGLAAKAGVQTGDRVVGLSYDSKHFHVRFYRAFIQELRRAQAAGTAQVELELQASQPEEKTAKDLKIASRRVMMPLPPLKAGADDLSLATDLGLNHAQLTVYSSSDGASNILQQGDQLLAWAGKPIQDSFQLRDYSLGQTEPSVDLKIARAGHILTVTVQLKPVEIQKVEGKAYFYSLPIVYWGGLEQPEPVYERYDTVLGALDFGQRETYEQGKMIFYAVVGLLTGDMPPQALGGPISIAKVASDSVRLGWQSFVMAMALVSINLGLLNLFPIPILDGGQLLLIGVEVVRRRPLTTVMIENYQKVGFVMVMSLVVMATYNDLSRFWTSIVAGVMGVRP